MSVRVQAPGVADPNDPNAVTPGGLTPEIAAAVIVLGALGFLVAIRTGFRSLIPRL